MFEIQIYLFGLSNKDTIFIKIGIDNINEPYNHIIKLNVIEGK